MLAEGAAGRKTLVAAAGGVGHYWRLGGRIGERSPELTDNRDDSLGPEWGAILEAGGNRLQGAISEVSCATASVTGSEFLHELVRSMAQSLDFSHAFVAAHRGDPVSHARALAVWSDGSFGDGFEYELARTPCEQVVRAAAFHVERDLRQHFGQPPQLAQWGIESYFGVSLRDALGACVGHLVMLGTEPRPMSLEVRGTMSAFAPRAGVEVERLSAAHGDVELSSKLRLLVDALPVCVAYVDAGERYRYTNATYRAWHTLADGGIEGRSVRDVLGEDAYAVVRTRIAGALRGEAQSFDYRARYRHGEHRDVHVEYVPDVLADDNVAGFYGLVYDISDRKQTEQQLTSYQNKLRGLATRLMVAEEQERHRIAEGLHDETLQTLMAIRLILSSLVNDASPRHAGPAVRKAIALTEQVIRETRTLVFDLSPPVLYDLGLESALEWLSEKLNGLHGIEYEVRDERRNKDIEKDRAAFVFRAVRELWINAFKHGKATRVRTTLEDNGRCLKVAIRDDGVGFRVSETTDGAGAGFGLFSIRERLDGLGGALHIDSSSRGGSTVTLSIPVSGTA